MNDSGNEEAVSVRARQVHAGRCLCGAIRVFVRGPLAPMMYCHCAQCRRTAGAPFLAVLPVAAEAWSLEDPQHLLGEFRASPDKARCFCTRCGAPVFSRRDGVPGVRVRAGLFDELGGVTHAGHIFAASAAPWHDITGKLPRYAGLEPGRASRPSS